MLTHMRISGDDWSKIEPMISKFQCGGFAVFEYGKKDKNPHFHITLDGVNNDAKHRMQVTRMFGKTYYWRQVQDEDKNLRYMSKGASSREDPVVVWHETLRYTREQIADAHVRYWEVQKEWKDNEHKVKRSMFEEVYEESKKRCSWKDAEEIASIYLDVCEEQNKYFDKYSLKKVVNLVQLKMCPNDDFKKQFIRESLY